MSKIVFFKVDDNEERRELHVALRENNYGIEILIEGYGCMAADPGTAGILHLEVAPNGYVRLYVWGDITSSEPTHVINLEGASEEYRQEE